MVFGLYSSVTIIEPKEGTYIIKLESCGGRDRKTAL